MERNLHYSRGGRKDSAGVEVDWLRLVSLEQSIDFLALRPGGQGVGDLEISTVISDLNF